MALQNSLEKRINNARRIINVAMARNDVKPKDIGTHKIMNANTFYTKKEKTDRLKFSDLWRLDDLLHFTDEEILQFFGRG